MGKLHPMEIGYMCHVPLKFSVDAIYTRSVKYTIEYLKYKHNFLVYFPTNISPDEAQLRVKLKLREHFFKIKKDHEEFEDLKKFFIESKNKSVDYTFRKFDLGNDKKKREFDNWIEMRHNNIDDHGYKICYCGHTDTCECSDPCQTLFEESIKNKTLDPTDPKNGWKNLKEEE